MIPNLFVGSRHASTWPRIGWPTRAGRVPQRYGEIFLALADHGVIGRPLALRLAAAAGLRKLVAHQYGTLEWARIYTAASSTDLDDLEAFCAALAAKLR